MTHTIIWDLSYLLFLFITAHRNSHVFVYLAAKLSVLSWPCGSLHTSLVHTVVIMYNTVRYPAFPHMSYLFLRSRLSDRSEE